MFYARPFRASDIGRLAACHGHMLDTVPSPWRRSFAPPHSNKESGNPAWRFLPLPGRLVLGHSPFSPGKLSVPLAELHSLVA